MAVDLLERGINVNDLVIEEPTKETGNFWQADQQALLGYVNGELLMASETMLWDYWWKYAILFNSTKQVLLVRGALEEHSRLRDYKRPELAAVWAQYFGDTPLKFSEETKDAWNFRLKKDFEEQLTAEETLRADAKMCVVFPQLLQEVGISQPHDRFFKTVENKRVYLGTRLAAAQAMRLMFPNIDVRKYFTTEEIETLRNSYYASREENNYYKMLDYAFNYALICASKVIVDQNGVRLEGLDTATNIKEASLPQERSF